MYAMDDGDPFQPARRRGWFRVLGTAQGWSDLSEVPTLLIPGKDFLQALPRGCATRFFFFGRSLVEADALGGFVPTYENPMLPIWLPSLGDEHTSNSYFGVQGTKVWSIPRWVKPDLRMCQVSAMNVPPPSPAEEGTNLWVFWSPQAMLKPFPCL